VPGAISGRQLAQLAVERVPTPRILWILFTSGYIEKLIVHNGRLDPGVELLSNPYGRQQLAAKVRRVLDGAPKELRRSAEIWHCRWKHRVWIAHKHGGSAVEGVVIERQDAGLGLLKADALEH
jgi:hypothetical protein